MEKSQAVEENNSDDLIPDKESMPASIAPILTEGIQKRIKDLLREFTDTVLKETNIPEHRCEFINYTIMAKLIGENRANLRSYRSVHYLAQEVYRAVIDNLYSDEVKIELKEVEESVDRIANNSFVSAIYSDDDVENKIWVDELLVKFLEEYHYEKALSSLEQASLVNASTRSLKTTRKAYAELYGYSQCASSIFNLLGEKKSDSYKLFEWLLVLSQLEYRIPVLINAEWFEVDVFIIKAFEQIAKISGSFLRRYYFVLTTREYNKYKKEWWAYQNLKENLAAYLRRGGESLEEAINKYEKRKLQQRTKVEMAEKQFVKFVEGELTSIWIIEENLEELLSQRENVAEKIEKLDKKLGNEYDRMEEFESYLNSYYQLVENAFKDDLEKLEDLLSKRPDLFNKEAVLMSRMEDLWKAVYKSDSLDEVLAEMNII